jgi:hypothetical protein
LITILDTISWGKELTTGNAEFVETADNLLYIVSNVRNNGFGFGSGFGNSFASPYQFVILKSDPVPPAPGPGSSFGALPPANVPVATYTFPQPTISFDPVAAFDASNGLLHILGSRNTPTGGNTSSTQTNDLIKFTYDTVGHTLSGPFVIGASVGNRIRNAYDIGVLDTDNTVVAAAFTDPAITMPPLVAHITAVAVSSEDIVTFTVASMPVQFVPNQWVLIDGLTNAAFLNGAVIQVQTATATSFTAIFQTGFYPPTAEPAGATASAVGSSLFAVELDKTTNQPVPGTATIIASSPSRSGDTYDGVTLLINGKSVDLYYQSHPKLVTFKDQIFSINHIGRNSPPLDGFGLNFGNDFGLAGQGFGFNFGIDFGENGIWDSAPQVLFTFPARYSDNRLTVVQDQAGNRYLSLTYWAQLNHPEGIVGNVLMGVQHGTSQPWFFHPTFGTTTGGSIIQSSVSVARNGNVSLTYLLQPFEPVANPPLGTSASWPLQVSTVDPVSLGLTNVPGFYNTLNLTWLRGTKSLIDNASNWALVGEREILSTAIGEQHVLSGTNPRVLVNNSPGYFEDTAVVYFPNLTPFVRVDTNPQQGQYTVDTSIGLYEFNVLDDGQTVAITYEYVSAIVPVYASLFNVPPIANLVPASATEWRNGTFYATDVVHVTNVAISVGTITIFAANDFTPGQQIALYGFANPSNAFLNGITLSVSTASPTQFTASFSNPTLPLGFGSDFGLDFGNNFVYTSDAGFAAALIPGFLNLSAAGSTDADQDALTYIWTENDPNLTDVFLSPTGQTSSPTTTVHVLGAVGPDQQNFDVGVAVIDLFPDLVTQRHPAMVVTDIQVATGGILTLTYTAPTGAEVPIAGEQIMLYDIVLGAPPAPTFNTVVGGSLPVQGAPGFGWEFGAQFGWLQPISVIITYVNSEGETVGSANAIYMAPLPFGGSAVPANHLLVVVSPVGAGGAGDATGYNVYLGLPGQESLQPNNAGLYHPTPLGTNWIEPVTGFTNINTPPPTTSGAIQEFLNDQIFTITAATPTTLTATISLGFGFDFGFDFGVSSFPLTAVTGFAISQFQFARTVVTVPENVAPVATFPAPEWNLGNVLATTVPRNTRITITPFTISDPTTQFPVIYTGLTDPDDVPTYKWVQTSGTTVVLPKGTTSPSLVIETNGVNLNGETLGFSLTIADGINTPFTTNFTLSVAAYVFNAANQDSLQVSRSIYSTSAVVNEVTIVNGFATFATSTNSFVAGQKVWFEGMTGATFLDNATFTILPTGFGQGFGTNFGSTSLNSTQFQVYDPTLTNYGPSPDSGSAFSPMPISQRNANIGNSAWSPLDISIFFNNLQTIKRTSVLDGSDRYIIVSPHSVLVYGVFASESPVAVLLRRIFLPNSGIFILDAVHTEQDYTLVLGADGNIYRYSTGPFINTDNPDTIITISNFTSLSFADADLANDVHIFTTVNFSNQRVIVLSGEQGALLMQVNTTTLAVTGTFELTIAANFVYGANKVQFVRWVNMDTLTSGLILLGTILNKSAAITNIALASNALTITANNTFAVGDMVTLSGITNATFLNGLTLKVIAATLTTFEASLAHADYTSLSDTGLAQSQTSGSTFETLIDLSQQQIIGTFDKSKLRNQFVETGEIMFDPDDTYSGGPTPPVLLPITKTVLGGNTNLVLTWQQVRPDLINSYTVQIALETNIAINVPTTAPFQFQVPANYQFSGDEGVFDGTVNGPMQFTAQASPLTGQYNATSTGLYTFNPAQAGHYVSITVRGAFNTFQVVPEGSVQSILASVPVGSTYFFQVQASGVDGTSGFSNIQSTGQLLITPPPPQPAVITAIAQGVGVFGITVVLNAANNFTAGQKITLSGLSLNPVLNGQTFILTGATPAQLEFSYTPAITAGAETGLATITM